MPTTVTDDAVKSHRDFVLRLERELKLRHRGKFPTASMQLEEKQQLCEQLKQRLEATVSARQKVIARYDEEVRRREEQIRQLEEELGQSKQAAKKKRRRRTGNG